MIDTSWLLPLFQGTVQVSLCLAPILLVLWLLRKQTAERSAPSVRCCVWSLCALRLLFPFRLALPAPAVLSAPRPALYPLEGTLPPLMVGDGLAAAAPLIPWGELLAISWLVGAALFLGEQCLRHLSLCRKLRRWSLSMQEDRANDLLFSLRREMGVKRTVGLCQSAVIDAPVLVGLFRPTLYLPIRPLEPEQLAVVFRHELTHLQRRDLWQNALLLGARTLHWFNPLVHWMAQWAREDQELACDAQALSGADSPARFNYGLTLLVLARQSPSASSCLLSSFAANEDSLETRIHGIAHPKPPRRGATVAVALSALLLSTLLLTGWALSPRAQKEEFPTAETPMEPAEQAATPSAVHPELPLKLPVEGTVYRSSAYGWRYNGADFHSGLDLTAEDIYRQEVLAAAGGTVVYAGPEHYEPGTGYGRYIILDHGDGWSTLYAHLDECAAEVGQTVEAGETIGKVGSTGNATGPVLHFEVRKDGHHENPEPHLPAIPSAAPAGNES